MLRPLRRHVVEGYYPTRTFVSGGNFGSVDRTVTNMLGEKLKLLGSEPLLINGTPIGNGDNTLVVNGNRVFYMINALIAPPK